MFAFLRSLLTLTTVALPIAATTVWYATGKNLPDAEVPFLNDLQDCTIPEVSWVIPDGKWSDHASSNKGLGPSYVDAIVNAANSSLLGGGGGGIAGAREQPAAARQQVRIAKPEARAGPGCLKRGRLRAWCLKRDCFKVAGPWWKCVLTNSLFRGQTSINSRACGL